MRIESNTDENWNESELPGNAQWQLPGHFILCQSLFIDIEFSEKTTCDMIASILSFEFVAFGSLSAVEDWLIARISSTWPSEAKISSFVWNFQGHYKVIWGSNYLYFNTWSNDANFVRISPWCWRGRTIIWCRTRTSLKFDYTRFGQVWPNVTTDNA